MNFKIFNSIFRIIFKNLLKIKDMNTIAISKYAVFTNKPLTKYFSGTFYQISFKDAYGNLIPIRTSYFGDDDYLQEIEQAIFKMEIELAILE
jgi:hypothetical protein